MAWEAHSLSVLTEGRFEMGIGTGLPGIEDELHQLGLAVVSPGEQLAQVRDAVTSLRGLDGADFHTPIVMAVRGPKARALAADLADTVTLATAPGESRPRSCRWRPSSARSETSNSHSTCQWSVTPCPRSWHPPDTDPAALRAADSLLVLPSDPAAAVEEILRRREEGGFSYFVIGANAADALAPVVAELTGH
jgi:alkanesulfonate monooxygenase SsuD/methylene tetrahydromethanopterin reductase-like flavin-dependent oxidoreductase (luciferase family)